MLGVCAPSNVVDGHMMDALSYCYHHGVVPMNLGEVAEIPGDVSVQTMRLCYG
jgi:hypothetical protein